MSRSKRKQRQRKSFPWLLLVFGGLLLVAAAFLFASKSGAGGGGGDDGTGTPKIAADPEKIDYGYVKFGNNETFKIKVTNTGDGVLRFKDKPNVEVLEGC